MKMKSLSLFLPVLFVPGLLTECSNRSHVEIPSHVGKLENVTIYGKDVVAKSIIDFKQEKIYVDTGDPENVTIGQIGAVNVDDSDNVYIAESASGNQSIHVFEPDGSYAGRIGRYGPGPGEFNFITDIQILDDVLYVLDMSLIRIQRFSLSSRKLLNVINLNTDQLPQSEDAFLLSPTSFRVYDENTFLVEFHAFTTVRDTRSFFLFDQQGNMISEKLLQLDHTEHLRDPGSTGTIANPLSNYSIYDLSMENEIFTASTEEFFVKVHDSTGKYKRSFYHTFQNSPLDRQQVLEVTENFEEAQRAILHAGIPDTWPALNSMVVDDENRLWISTIVDDRQVHEWWILNEYGELLATFRWPRNRVVRAIKNGRLYAEEWDAETHARQIIAYRLKWSDLE